MRFSRFYTDQELRSNEAVKILGPRAHYMRNVLRLSPGDCLSLFNGKGGEYEAKINSINKHEVSIDVLAFFDQNRQSNLLIELGIAIIKREAMDAVIQKATELGVSKIQPLFCQNNTVSPKALGKRLAHWKEISINACEQCGLNILPEISSPTETQSWFDGEANLKLIASPRGRENLSQFTTNPTKIFIAIGPEGGFVTEEIDDAVNKGFKEISLGARILRADTAVTTMMSLSQFCWGDL